MRLYKNDYTNISDEEKAIVEKWTRKTEFTPKDMFTGLGKKFYSNKNIQHYISLFPNNYLLFINDIPNYKTIYQKKLNDFVRLIENPSSTEREVINYINKTESYFIISSLLKYTDFGHHDAYIFPEFNLAPSYKADYLVVGKNSHGYHFLFVELEAPYSNSIVQNDGSLGLTFRKGLSQIDDWMVFLEQNYQVFQLVFEKLIKSGEQLPQEFYKYDRTRFYFAVVGGRRKNFNEKTYRIKRKILKSQDIHVLHYDNLVDLAGLSIESGKCSI